MGTNLSKFDIGDKKVESGKVKLLTWSFVNYCFFDSALPWPYFIKVGVLRLFGAKIGAKLLIEPKVRIEKPWRLIIGNNCRIEESVLIDNLEYVNIGNNVSLSKGAKLLTGKNDYTLEAFPHSLGKITVEDGVWIGAKAVVCPGVICKSRAILTVNSVATKDLEANSIYAGSPAVYVRSREFNDA